MLIFYRFILLSHGSNQLTRILANWLKIFLGLYCHIVKAEKSKYCKYWYITLIFNWKIYNYMIWSQSVLLMNQCQHCHQSVNKSQNSTTNQYILKRKEVILAGCEDMKMNIIKLSNCLIITNSFIAVQIRALDEVGGGVQTYMVTLTIGLSMERLFSMVAFISSLWNHLGNASHPSRVSADPLGDFHNQHVSMSISIGVVMSSSSVAVSPYPRVIHMVWCVGGVLVLTNDPV